MNKPSYSDLEKRISELEQQISRLQSIAVKYQTLFHSFPHGITISDAQGKIIETNAAAEKMLGVSKEEHEKRAIDGQEWKIIRPGGSDMPPEEWASVIALTENRVVTDCELGIVKSAHEVTWINVSAAPIPLSGHGVVVTYADITEKKKFEEKLRKSENLLQRVFEILPVGLWFADKNGKLLRGNPMGVRIWGAEPHVGIEEYGVFRARRLPSGEEITPDDWALVHTVGEGVTVMDELLEIDAFDGLKKTILNYTAPVLDSHGKVEAAVIVNLDVTERKNAEDALHASHERFLAVLNSIDATIYVADLETYEILFMNRCMIDTFGRDMTGEICWKVFRGESGPCACCTNHRLVDENGKPTDVCVWHDRNPITGKWYINHDRAIEWTDGRLVRIQIATDITEYKQLEERLYQAQKMEAIGTLAGGIAHDFNNILSSIIGFTELSLDDVEKGSILEDNLKEVFTAGKRAKEMVRQILAFARQSEKVLQPIQVNMIVKEVIKLIRSSIPSVIEIRSNIASDSRMMGDPAQIHQILMNLCSNAAYAMEETGGILDISLDNIAIDRTSGLVKTGLSPGHYIRLIVSDTGTGIPPNIIHSIFEPYFTTKPFGEGTGMGLAMVHGIVEGCGGKIMVDSQPQKGTVFTIYLPAIQKRAVSGLVEPEQLPLGTERILLVDDEEPIVRIASRILQRLGYQVTTRTSSVDALELFRSRAYDFDLVISDMTMPNMTGDRLAVELMGIRPDIPVILCTGYSRKISDETAERIGVKAFCYKPIVKADLAKTVRNILDKVKNRS